MTLALWLLAGGGVGALNGLTQWWTVSQLRSTMRLDSLTLTLGGMLVRLGLVAGLLIVALKQGITPGLLAFAGLWLTRWVGVIWFGLPRGSTDQRPETCLWSDRRGDDAGLFP